MRWREGKRGNGPAGCRGDMDGKGHVARQGVVVRIREQMSMTAGRAARSVRRTGMRLVATAIAFGTLTGGVIFSYAAYGPGTMAYATPVNVVDESNRIDDGMVDVQSLTDGDGDAEATEDSGNESNLARRGTYTQLTREQIANAQPVPALVVLDGNRVGTDLKTLIPSTDMDSLTVMGKFDAKGSGLYGEQMLAADGDHVIKSPEDENDPTVNHQDKDSFTFGFYYYFSKFFGNFGYGANVDQALMESIRKSFGQYGYDGLYVYYNGQKRARVAWAGMIDGKTYVLAHDGTQAYAKNGADLVAQQCTPWKDDKKLQKGNGNNIKDETNDCFLTEIPNVTTATASSGNYGDIEFANPVESGKPYLAASFSSTGAVQVYYGQDTRDNKGNDGGNSELSDTTGRADFSLTQTTAAPGGQVSLRAFTSEAGTSLKVYVRETDKEPTVDPNTGRITAFPTDWNADYKPWVGFDGNEVEADSGGKVHFTRTNDEGELTGYTPELREYELRVDVSESSSKNIEIYVTQSKDYGDQAPAPDGNADASKIIVSGQIKTTAGTDAELKADGMLDLKQLYTIANGSIGPPSRVDQKYYFYCPPTWADSNQFKCANKPASKPDEQIYNEDISGQTWDKTVRNGRGMRGASYVAGWRINRKDKNSDDTYEKNDYSGRNGGNQVFVPGEYMSGNSYVGQAFNGNETAWDEMLTRCLSDYTTATCKYWRQTLLGGLEAPAWWDNPYFNDNDKNWTHLRIGPSGSGFSVSRGGDPTDYAYNGGKPYASDSYDSRFKTTDTAPYGIGKGTDINTDKTYCSSSAPWQWMYPAGNGSNMIWQPIQCDSVQNFGTKSFYSGEQVTNTIGYVWDERNQGWLNGSYANVTGQFGSVDGMSDERGQVGDTYVLAFYNSVRSGCKADIGDTNPNKSLGADKESSIVGKCDEDTFGSDDTGQTQVPTALQLCARKTNSGTEAVSCDGTGDDIIRTTVNLPTYVSMQGGNDLKRTWSLTNAGGSEPLGWDPRNYNEWATYDHSMTTELTEGPFAGMTVTVRETAPWYLDQNEKFGGRKFHYSSHVMLVTLDNVTTSVDVKMTYEKAQYPTFALGDTSGMQDVQIRTAENKNSGNTNWTDFEQALSVRQELTTSLRGQAPTSYGRKAMVGIVRFRPAFGYQSNNVRVNGGRQNATSTTSILNLCLATDSSANDQYCADSGGNNIKVNPDKRPDNQGYANMFSGGFAGSELVNVNKEKNVPEPTAGYGTTGPVDGQKAWDWTFHTNQCVPLRRDYVNATTSNPTGEKTLLPDGTLAQLPDTGQYITCFINATNKTGASFENFYASPLQFGATSDTKDTVYKLRFYPGYRDGDKSANPSGTINYNGQGALTTTGEQLDGSGAKNPDTMRLCTADEMSEPGGGVATPSGSGDYQGCVDPSTIDTRVQSYNLAGVGSDYQLTVPSSKPRYVQTAQEKASGKMLYFQGWAPFFGLNTTGKSELGDAMATIPGMTTSAANGIGGAYQVGEMGLIRPGQSVPVSAVTPSSNVVALRMRAVWSEVSLADSGNVRVVSYTQTYQPASGNGADAKSEEYGWTDTVNANDVNVNQTTKDTTMYLVLKDDTTEGGTGWKATYASASKPADLIERLFDQASGDSANGDKTFDRDGDEDGKVTGVKNGVQVQGKLSSGTKVSGEGALKTGDGSTGTLAAVNFNNESLVRCEAVRQSHDGNNTFVVSSPLLGMEKTFGNDILATVAMGKHMDKINGYCGDAKDQLGNDPLNLGKLPSTASDVVFAALFREPAAMTYQTSGLYLPEGTTEPNADRDRWFSIDTANETNSTQPDKDTTGETYSAFANENPQHTGRWKYDRVKMPTFGDHKRDAYKDTALDWRYCGYASDDGSDVDCKDTQLTGDPQGWVPENGPVKDSKGQGRYQAPFFPNDGQHADDPVDANGKPKPSTGIQAMNAVVTMTEANREWAAIWHPGGAVTLRLRKVSQAQSGDGLPDSLKGGKFRLYHLSENCYKYGVDVATSQCKTTGTPLTHEDIDYDDLDLAKNPALLDNLGYPDVEATGSTSDNPNDSNWKNRNENWHPHPAYGDEFEATAEGDDGLITFSSLVLGGNEIAGSGGEKTLDYSQMWFALVETEAPQGYDTPTGAVWYFRLDPTVKLAESTDAGKETPRSGLIYTIRTTTEKDGNSNTVPSYGTVFSGKAKTTGSGGAGAPNSAIDRTAQVPAMMTSETLAGGDELDTTYAAADLARLTNDGGLRLPMAGISSLLWRSLLVGAILTLGAWLAYDRYRRRQAPVAVTGHHLCL